MTKTHPVNPVAIAVLVSLFIAAVILSISLAIAGSYALTIHEIDISNAKQAAAGQVVERKLCTTLDNLAALKPPAGSPDKNPSRAYLQDLHRTLAQLSPDVGCSK